MKLEKGYMPVVSFGHGGVIGGNYNCLAGGKEHTFSTGETIHEGMLNRWLGNNFMWYLYRKGIPFYEGHVTGDDATLKKRVNKINKIYAKNKKTYLFCIHHNAFNSQAKGLEIFTSPGQTKSDLIAEEYLVSLENNFSDIAKMRFDNSDGDRDKEARYTMITDTDGPAILAEFAFFDNKSDLWILNNKKLLRAITIITDVAKDIYLNGIE